MKKYFFTIKIIPTFHFSVIQSLFCFFLIFSSHTSLSEEESSNVEKIKVTGSRISRIDIEGPSPLIIYSKEDLENSGYESAGDFLRDTTSAHFGVERETAGTAVSGSSFIALKGERTLILINGLRVVEDPIGNAVDLNQIPIYAIERVEILKDGGSALYGSDAVGGVINFITKKDFSGSEVHAQVTPTIYPWYQGGSRADATFVFGNRKDKWSYIGSFHMRFQDSIDNHQRELTNKSLSPTLPCPRFNEVLHLPCIEVLQKYSQERKSSAPVVIENIDPDTKEKSYQINFAPFSNRYPLYKQAYAFFQGDYKLGAETTLYTQLIASYKVNEWSYAPLPGNIEIPAEHKMSQWTNTAGKLKHRFLEAGRRNFTYEDITADLTLGAKGYLSASWDYDFNVKLAHFLKRHEFKGLMLKDKLQEIFLTGAYDPYYLNTEDMYTVLDQLKDNSYKLKAFQGRDITSAVYNGKTKSFASLLVGTLDFSGESGIWDIELATGFQFYARNYRSIEDEQSKAKNLVSPAGSTGQGQRSVLSYYLEGVKFFSDVLEVQLAGRADYYSDDFGLTMNPKASFRYKPLSNFLLRGSISRAFVAPSLSQLNTSESEDYPSLFDTRACYNELQASNSFKDVFAKLPNMNDKEKSNLARDFLIEQKEVIARKELSEDVKTELKKVADKFSGKKYCKHRQVLTQYFGNKSLKETQAWVASLGSHFQIDEHHSLTVDIWYITKNGVPSNGLGKKTFDAELLFGPEYVANYQNYDVIEDKEGNKVAQAKKEQVENKEGIIITRDPQNEHKALLNGPHGVITKLLNLGNTQQAGMDLDWESQMNNINIYNGNPYFKDTFSYMFFTNVESFPGMGYINGIGKWGLPTWKNQAVIGWKNRRHNISLIANTVSGFAKQSNELVSLPIYTRFDLNYQWLISEKTTLKFGWSDLLFPLAIINPPENNDKERSLAFDAPPADRDADSDKLAHDIFESRGPYLFVGVKHKF